MPRMLIELQKNPSLGLVGKPRTYLSGRTILVWQYWESFEKLTACSKATNNAHLPAWRAFNKNIRDNGSVGIYHETILTQQSKPFTETCLCLALPLSQVLSLRANVGKLQRLE
jgi:hypothetical protein